MVKAPICVRNGVLWAGSHPQRACFMVCSGKIPNCRYVVQRCLIFAICGMKRHDVAGGAMVAARRIIALSVDADQRLALVEISRSRTEPANRVERARIILAYLEEPSAYAVASAMRVSQQTVTRCLERAAELGVLAAGVLAALDDRARARDGMRGLRWRPEPGLSGWLARSRRNLVIRTSCGPPDCWLRMRAITDRALAIQAWQTWPRERCARSSPRMRSNRTGCVTTWSGAIASSNPKWPRCFASIVRSRCGGRPWVELHRSPPSR